MFRGNQSKMEDISTEFSSVRRVRNLSLDQMVQGLQRALEENELIRLGLREPKELAPLETGQELASAVATEAEGNAKKADDADSNKVDLTKAGNDDGAPAGDADKKPSPGIQFHQGQGPKT